MKMNSPSYYTSADISFALTLDSAIMDIPVDCRYIYYHSSQLDEYAPVEPAHVEVTSVFLHPSDQTKFDLLPIIRQDDSMVKMLNSVLLEIELNNQE